MRTFRATIAIIALASLLLAAPNSLAAPITTPGDLLPGEQYRLAFVSSTTRDATSSLISDYDTHVLNAANAVTELAALGTTWQVIGSTSSVDAIVHTGTDVGPGSTVPIYSLIGTRLADDGLDLWDSELDNALNVDENGIMVGSVFPWTGSCSDGTRAYWDGVVGGDGACSASPEIEFFLGLGDGDVASFDPAAQGDAQLVTGGGWVLAKGVATTRESPLYALSGVLTVPVPEPGTSPLLAIAFATLLLSHGTARGNKRLYRQS